MTQPPAGHCPFCADRGFAVGDATIAQRVLEFLDDLRVPDGFGFAVTAEVRSRARELASQMRASIATGKSTESS